MVQFYRIGAFEIIRFRRILSYEVPADDGTVYDFLLSFIDYKRRPEDFKESNSMIDQLQETYLSGIDATVMDRTIHGIVQKHVGVRNLTPLSMFVRYIAGVPALRPKNGEYQVDLTGIFLRVKPMALDMLAAHILKKKFNYDISGVGIDEMLIKIEQILKER
jgi:hypothetical protein